MDITRSIVIYCRYHFYIWLYRSECWGREFVTTRIGCVTIGKQYGHPLLRYSLSTAHEARRIHHYPTTHSHQQFGTWLYFKNYSKFGR